MTYEARTGLAWLGGDGLGRAWSCEARPGMAAQGVTWQGKEGDRQSPGFETLAPAQGRHGHGPARQGHAMPGVEWPGAARRCAARSGGVRHGLVWQGVARRGEARQGFNGVDEASAAWRGRVAHGTARRVRDGLGGPGWAGDFGRLAEIGVRLLDAHARLGAARQGLVRHGVVRCGMAGRWHGPAGLGTAPRGKAGTPLWINGVDRTSAAWLGLPRSGEDSRGEARLVLARCGLAMRGRDVKQRLGCDARASHSHGWAWHRQCWDRQAPVGRGAAWQGMELLHLGR